MNDSTTEMAIPGTHDRFLGFFAKLVETCFDGRCFDKLSMLRVLDVGAGQGALSRKLHDAGFDVSACELHPEIFKCDGVECRAADLTQSLPYDDAAFDAAVAVEVMEHLTNPDRLFAEAARVLKDGGVFAMSTPNILSLKSRLRFAACGFFYSFRPLDLQNKHGLEHVNSFTLDQYRYVARRNGFEIARVGVDKRQISSILLLGFVPLLCLLAKLQRVSFSTHGKLDLLLGRKLFIAFKRVARDG
jgi:SAM-dependent methyltransferase